jgi:hypothetical protein
MDFLVMKQLSSTFILILSCLSLVKAQAIVHSPSGIYSIVPKHKHPDSIYAKVLFSITVHPGNKKDIKKFKTICENCDTPTIRSIEKQALREAILDKSIIRILPPEGDYIEEKYIYPVQISILKPR